MAHKMITDKHSLDCIREHLDMCKAADYPHYKQLYVDIDTGAVRSNCEVSANSYICYKDSSLKQIDNVCPERMSGYGSIRYISKLLELQHSFRALGFDFDIKETRYTEMLKLLEKREWTDIDGLMFEIQQYGIPSEIWAINERKFKEYGESIECHC